MESYTAMRSARKLGTDRDSMNREMIQEVAKALNILQPAREEIRTIGMNEWLRDATTPATTRSVYDPMNPYEDRSIAEAFW
jgi:hypothetical protein